MMPILWPAELPNDPLMAGYADAPSDRRLAWKPDVGPPIMRQRANWRYGYITATFMLTAVQARILEDFFEATTIGGTEPFYWFHPRRSTSIQCIFDPESPPPELTKVMHSTYWQVTLKFRVVFEEPGLVGSPGPPG